MKQIQTISYYYIKELFNEWNASNKNVFFSKVIFMILVTSTISAYVSPWQKFSDINIIVIIIIQTIILTWLQTLSEIGSSLFSLNKRTYPTLLGVDKHANTLALAVFFTYKNSLLGLGISIIFSESYYFTFLYFAIYLISSILSFQFAMIFLVVWIRFIKSFNLLIILSFLSQFVLLTVITLLIYKNYKIRNMEYVINGVGLFSLLYLLISAIILFLSIINKQRFNSFYLFSINNYHNFGKADNANKERVIFVNSIINPVIFKDLILTLTNPLTKVRLYVWGIIQVILIYILFQKGFMFFVNILPFSSEHPEWFVLHINVIITFLIFGEVVLSLFKMDQGILEWYSFTKYNSSKILRSKIMLGVTLLSIPNIISTMIYSLILGFNLSGILFIIVESIIFLLVITMSTLSISSLEVKTKKYSSSKATNDTIVSEQIPESLTSYVSLFTGFILLIIFYLGINRYSEVHVLDFIAFTLSVIVSILLYQISNKIYTRNMNSKL